MRRGLFIGVLLFTAQREATAQCRVPTDSNEGKLLAFYTAPIVFSMAIAPDVLLPASIRIGAEGEYIPKPDPTIEQTGRCFTQKSEHTSLSPVFGRPRIYDRRPVRLCPRGRIPSSGDDRESYAESLQLRRIACSSFRARSRFKWNDPHAARAWHLWKRQRSDHLPEIAASADGALKSLLRDESIEGHFPSRHVWGRSRCGVCSGDPRDLILRWRGHKQDRSPFSGRVH